MMDDGNIFDNNPFAQPPARPSQPVNTGATPDAQVNATALDSYQPFSGSTDGVPQQPPPYSGSLTTQLEQRQRELDARAAELERREAEQRRVEVEQARAIGATQKNFPPLPSFFPLKPCFYQDINLEIPEEHRLIVNRIFYMWTAYAVLLAINFLGSILYMAGSSNDNGAATFFLALVVLLFCPMASYVCWFRPAYKAFRTDSSFNFFIFFFVMAGQICVIFLQATSFFQTGTCGLLRALSVTKVAWLFVVMLLITVCFIGMLLVMIYMTVMVQRVFRNKGGSLDKAKSEIASNPDVRTTFFSAIFGGGAQPHSNSSSGGGGKF